jgi:hypothetical protein
MQQKNEIKRELRKAIERKEFERTEIANIQLIEQNERSYNE